MPTNKPPYHHGDLARALVEAAERSIEAGGYSRLTLRQTARDAGVSVAAPYRHFTDREALLAAVLTKGFRELTRQTEAARLKAADPKRALLAVGLAYVRFAAQHPAIYRLMFGPECDKATHPELMTAGHEALCVLVTAVADCKRAGLIGGANVQRVALAGWSLSHGLASLHVDGLLASIPGPGLERSAKALMHMLLAGVTASARPAPRREPPKGL